MSATVIPFPVLDRERPVSRELVALIREADDLTDEQLRKLRSYIPAILADVKSTG